LQRIYSRSERKSGPEWPEIKPAPQRLRQASDARSRPESSVDRRLCLPAVTASAPAPTGTPAAATAAHLLEDIALLETERLEAVQRRARAVAATPFDAKPAPYNKHHYAYGSIEEISVRLLSVKCLLVKANCGNAILHLRASSGGDSTAAICTEPVLLRNQTTAKRAPRAPPRRGLLGSYSLWRMTSILPLRAHQSSPTSFPQVLPSGVAIARCELRSNPRRDGSQLPYNPISGLCSSQLSPSPAFQKYLAHSCGEMAPSTKQ